MFFRKKSAFDYAFDGEKLLLEKNYTKAIVFYNKAISIAEKENFENIDLYFSSRATINKNLGNLNEALSDINKAIEKQPNVYLYYFDRAEIKEGLGDKESAEADLKTVYEILRKNGSTHIFKLYLANKKVDEGNFKEAEKILDEEDVCFSNEPILLLKLKVHEKNHNYQKLIEDTNKLTELYPLRVIYFDKRIDAYINLNNFDEALKTADDALLIEPSNSHILLMKGQILYSKKEYNKAREALEKALSITISDSDRETCNMLLKEIKKIS